MEKRFFLLYLPAGTSAQMICVEIRKIYGVEFVDFEKETAINEANGYYNSMIPQARADASALISNAEAYKEEQIAKATGDTEKFLSMLTEYKNNSKIYSEDTTKYRLLLETMDKILPLVKMYIVDSADGNVDLKLYDSVLSGNISVTE